MKVLLALCLLGVTVAQRDVQVVYDDGCLELRYPDVRGISSVVFNFMIEGKDKSDPTFGTATKSGDWWSYRQQRVELSAGDKIHYSAMVDGILGRSNIPLKTWTYAPLLALPARKMRGPVMFREDFSGSFLDLNSWKVEVSLFGGMNWEFQAYTNQKENIFLQDGNLFLKPTLTIYDKKFDEAFLTTGKMDASTLWGDCTNSGNWGCMREGWSGMLPPIMSGKIMSRPTLRYGTVEVRARIPRGDWIWPAIWMMPRDSVYGGWPRSGEIDIMESRGNSRATAEDGKNHGTDEIGSTLHWGPAWNNNFYMLTHEEKFKPQGESWHSEFHTWRLDWTPEGLTTFVDNEEVMSVRPPAGGFYEKAKLGGENLWATGTKMAPFDQDFYLILNVAVGGTIGYFPDSWDYGVVKPWNNTSPQANADFWSRRSEWESTWHGNDVAMEVDYVEFRHL